MQFSFYIHAAFGYGTLQQPNRKAQLALEVRDRAGSVRLRTVQNTF